MIRLNATGGIRWFFKYQLDPFKERLGIRTVGSISMVMTSEMQDKTLLSQMHVK